MKYYEPKHIRMRCCKCGMNSKMLNGGGYCADCWTKLTPVQRAIARGKPEPEIVHSYVARPSRVGWFWFGWLMAMMTWLTFLVRGIIVWKGL